jgi:3-phosphoshikimate 1-carboxyvinyltransferase
MEKTIRPAAAAGGVRIPGSKSHTVRALIIAALADGKSTIGNPLDSSDTRSCVAACRAFGAKIDESAGDWRVTGTSGKPLTPENIVDVGNSGATLRLLSGIAALQENWVVFTGDSQIRSRPAEPLLKSLADLGAETISIRNNGRAPYLIGGRLSGGVTTIACPTSQYLSSLLLAAPLASGDSEINVSLLNERPYAEITLDWLDNQDIKYENDDFKQLRIAGNQGYKAFSRSIPGDFSSATFFLCAAAVCGTSIAVDGLDFNDAQGDKAVVEMLEKFGCRTEKSADGVVIHGKALTGCDIDLNATPDALPALAVTACFAAGRTRLLNVPQARLKETDRITGMREELTKMGARVEELPDGLIIHGRTEGNASPLKGARVDGRDDHRIVMALAIAGLAAEGETVIEGAEAVDITFPEFFTLLESIT